MKTYLIIVKYSDYQIDLRVWQKGISNKTARNEVKKAMQSKMDGEKIMVKMQSYPFCERQLNKALDIVN